MRQSLTRQVGVKDASARAVRAWRPRSILRHQFQTACRPAKVSGARHSLTLGMLECQAAGLWRGADCVARPDFSIALKISPAAVSLAAGFVTTPAFQIAIFYSAEIR